MTGTVEIQMLRLANSFSISELVMLLICINQSLSGESTGNVNFQPLGLAEPELYSGFNQSSSLTPSIHMELIPNG